MATRDLKTNAARMTRKTDKLLSFASRELIQNYNRALDDIRVRLSNLYEIYRTEGELTRAQATQFMRQSNIRAEIIRAADPYLAKNEKFLKELSKVGFNESFFHHAWAVDQAVGVELSWGLLDDNAVRAAIGLSDDAASLAGLMSKKEVRRHAKILDKAFKNYAIDSRKWIGREVTQGVINGESVDQVAKRISKSAFLHSRNSAELIARTETLRATGLGAQIRYEQAADAGVMVKQVWDAALDSRTRPEHAAMDGKIRDDETGLFPPPINAPGPRRTGNAGDDINCRCTVTPVVDGLSPEVRRIKGEGVKPYKPFSEWATEHGYTRNEYGQKYDFLAG